MWSRARPLNCAGTRFGRASLTESGPRSRYGARWSYLAGVEAVPGQRTDEFTLLVGEVGEERVGEQVDGLRHGAEIGRVPDEVDQGGIDFLEYVTYRVV